MKLRALVGVHAGQVRDYSPVAARGALATGMAERLDAELHAVTRTQVITAERQPPEKPKTYQSRRKG
jgi:hypothetical protein